MDQDEEDFDLFIFEAGGFEGFHVGISMDGVNFIEVGTVITPFTGIDIGPYVDPGDTFRFVRLIDTDWKASNYPTAGADIDAVGAIGSTVIPEPSTLVIWSLLGLAGAGVAGWRRKSGRAK